MIIDNALGNFNSGENLVQREIRKIEMRTEEINQRLDALTDFTISAMERIGKMSVKKEESMKKSSIKTGRK